MHISCLSWRLHAMTAGILFICHVQCMCHGGKLDDAGSILESGLTQMYVIKPSSQTCCSSLTISSSLSLCADTRHHMSNIICFLHIKQTASPPPSPLASPSPCLPSPLPPLTSWLLCPYLGWNFPCRQCNGEHSQKGRRTEDRSGSR